MLPLKDTVPARSFPIVNWLLIAANVVVFLIELSLGLNADLLTAALGVVPARLLGPVDPQLGQQAAASILKVVERKDINEIDDSTIILADMAEKAIRQVKATSR
jgi:hypothetical protein